MKKTFSFKILSTFALIISFLVYLVVPNHAQVNTNTEIGICETAPYITNAKQEQRDLSLSTFEFIKGDVVEIEMVIKPNYTTEDEVKNSFNFAYDLQSESFLAQNVDISEVIKSSNGTFTVRLKLNTSNLEFKQYRVGLETKTPGSTDGLFVVKSDGSDCVVRFKVVENPTTPMVSTRCEQIGSPYNYVTCINPNLTPNGWEPDDPFACSELVQQGSNTDLYALCNSYGGSISGGSFCAPCRKSTTTQLPKYQEECQKDCALNSLACTQIGSIKRCLYKQGSQAPLDTTGDCVIGAHNCGANATCAISRTDPGDLGQIGKCLSINAVNNSGVQCSGQNADQGCQSAAASKNPAKKYGWCENNFCKFSDYTKQQNQQSQILINPGSSSTLTATPNPIVPVISNKGIAACSGSLACVNCIGRKNIDSDRDGKNDEFASLQEAIAAVDATPSEFIYTNYIYTSLGCMDPSYEGTLTRVMQMILGSITLFLLVRIAQAVMEMQTQGVQGFKDGWEIISSAVFALIMTLIGVAGLVYIGVDLFNVFSPGTVSVENQPAVVSPQPTP